MHLVSRQDEQEITDLSSNWEAVANEEYRLHSR